MRPFNTWDLSLFQPWGLPFFPVLWFSYQNVHDHLGQGESLADTQVDRQNFLLRVLKSWTANTGYWSWQSHCSDLVQCAKTCEWSWRGIYCPLSLDGLRWSTVLQSIGCLHYSCCFSCITAQTASVCNPLREIEPFDKSKHQLMGTPKKVILTFVSFCIFWLVSFFGKSWLGQSIVELHSFRNESSC